MQHVLSADAPPNARANGSSMNFASDNVVGASRQVLEALLAANDGAEAAYGIDSHTRRAEAMLAEAFDHEVSVFLVATGTGANALALSALTPPWGAVFCHEESHVIDDECGAPEMFTDGAKLDRHQRRWGQVHVRRTAGGAGAIPSWRGQGRSAGCRVRFAGDGSRHALFPGGTRCHFRRLRRLRAFGCTSTVRGSPMRWWGSAARRPR